MTDLRTRIRTWNYRLHICSHRPPPPWKSKFFTTNRVWNRSFFFVLSNVVSFEKKYRPVLHISSRDLECFSQTILSRSDLRFTFYSIDSPHNLGGIVVCTSRVRFSVVFPAGHIWTEFVIKHLIRIHVIHELEVFLLDQTIESKWFFIRQTNRQTVECIGSA